MRRWGVPLLVATVAAAAVAGCGGGGGDGSSGGAPPAGSGNPAAIKGQTITVLLPSWAKIPDKILQQFETKSGVTVKMNIAPWDSIRDKISVAGASNSPLADVTEFDWSWTGQFGGAGWFVPLEKSLDKSLLSDLTNSSSFSTAGHLYGACYSNDFRLFQYNKKMFDQAGIKQPPATWDEVLQDARTLKQKGVVQYPLILPLEAAEDNPQFWYLATMAEGGKVFGDNFSPDFAAPGSGGEKALNFEVQALKEGLIPPGAVSMSNDAQGNWWRAGKAAMNYAAPGDLVVNNDKKQSSIVGQARPMLVPGSDGPGASYGLPEALGVMSSSQHKQAALAFVNWWLAPDTQKQIYDAVGLLPCRKSVFNSLVSAGKIEGGKVMAQELDHVQPLFPQGAPKWYTRFSTEAAAQINSAAKGGTTVRQALDTLAAKAKELAAG
jgi:multiple sugar transport system substrate-binding protein